MTNQNIVRTLNVVAAAGLTIGGASAIPGCNLPQAALFYGLLIAGIAKAVASELVQIKGQSDEAQGITPAQVTAVQQVHDQAKITNIVPPAPATTTTTTVAKTATLVAFILLCAGLYGCSTSAVTTAGKANGATVAAVDGAMTGWAQYVKTHTVSTGSILAVSNAYNVYYNSELVASNLFTVYAESPTTNNAQIAQNAITTVISSQSNLLNIVSTLSQ